MDVACKTPKAAVFKLRSFSPFFVVSLSCCLLFSHSHSEEGGVASIHFLYTSVFSALNIRCISTCWLYFSFPFNISVYCR